MLSAVEIDRSLRGSRLRRALVAASLFCAHGVGADPSDEFRVFFGNLHAHTSYSDGVQKPAFAYDYARDEGGLDFLAITEHNHAKAEGTGARRDNLHVAKNPALYDDLLDAARDRNDPGDFVTIWGQEFSIISRGNHVNVFGPGKVIDEDDIESGDYRALYEWMPNGSGVVLGQLNHPWDNDNAALQYGLKQYGGSHAQLRAALERAQVHLIEVINGPGTKDQRGLRSEVKGESHYKFYLTRGYRLAPTADQDNHWITWGTLTDARTGVLAESLNRTAILNALIARRCFASTDKNLKVWFKVNGAAMGDSATATSRTLQVEYEIRDEDEPNATYRVDLVDGNYRSSSSDQRHEVANGAGEGAASIAFRTNHNRAFVYLRVSQSAAAGQGTDTVITAPVWVDVN